MSPVDENICILLKNQGLYFEVLLNNFRQTPIGKFVKEEGEWNLQPEGPWYQE